MPTCGQCRNTCNCVVSEDGFYSGDITRGRNFTQVSGSGAADDPFVIHFMDQEDFRPRTAEVNWNSYAVANGSGGIGNYSNVNMGDSNGWSISYESPLNFLIVDATTDGGPRYVPGNFWYVGFSLTFAEVADSASNFRHLIIASGRGVFPGSVATVAGQTTPGAGGDPISLSVEGFIPGVFFQTPGIGSIIQDIRLYVFQNSGGPLMATDIKMWVTQI